MRTIILRRKSGSESRTRSGRRTRGGGKSRGIVEQGLSVDPAAAKDPPESGGFTMEIVKGPPAEAASDPDTIACGDPDMPVDLVQPFESASGASASKAGWGIEAVGASAEGLSVTGKGAVVAVLDTGIDFKHSAFAGIPFKDTDIADFTGTQAASVRDAVQDQHGHGTHCAGTIFGRDVDGQRIGVAPGVERVIVGKILGGRKQSTAEMIVEAVSWARDQGAQIISLSVGQNYPKYYAQLKEQYGDERRALNDVIASYVANVRLFDTFSELLSENSSVLRGALLVAAAGNESNRPAFASNLASPASGKQFLSVGALGADPAAAGKYTLAKFSNRGPRISAPGVGIWSAKRGGGLAALDGTSMATPHVAGVAALWIERLMARARGRVPQTQRIVTEIERASLDLSAYLASEDTGLGLVKAPPPP